MSDSVVIVVPVYNAYDELKRCVDSLFRYVDRSIHQILFINDNSSDKRIKPYLESLASPSVNLHHNEKNCGFSHNVNYGFSHSTQDVIILNTDTVVTKGWIDKLRRCAYSDPSIGTVTPFSNSATICSLPEFCEDNPLPEGFTVDSYAELIEKHSLREYPEIPVAVGFCMYIKREVIEAIGQFDEETFQRGYGEENDFCYRARLIGYRNVLCDDTFIYHSGTASFVPKEKKELIEAHERIVNAKYPALTAETERFCRENPIAKLQANVNVWTSISNGRKNILYILHRDFRENARDHVGGTQLHVRDLKDSLCQKYNIFVLARDGEQVVLSVYADHEKHMMCFHAGDAGAAVRFTSPKLREIYAKILDTFKIDIVHVHHLFEMSNDIFSLAKDRNIPIFMTIHDFYTICPSIVMMDNNHELCIGHDSPERCRACLASGEWYSAKVPVELDFIRKWRSEFLKCLKICDRVFYPSHSAMEYHLKYYPEIKAKARVIPHALSKPSTTEPKENESCTAQLDKVSPNATGISVSGWCVWKGKDSRKLDYSVHVMTHSGYRYVYPAPKSMRRDIAALQGDRNYLMSGFCANISAYTFKAARTIQIGQFDGEETALSKPIFVNEHDKGLAKSPKTCLRIAFVGGMTEGKGSKLALEMIRLLPQNVEWYLFGDIGDEKLRLYEQRNFHKFGRYQREDIANLLEEYQIDLVCIPTVSPETFCYVLSETLASGIPALVSDIGALGERIKNNGCGWLIPKGAGATAFAEQILHLLHEPKEYEEKKRIVENHREWTVAEMSEVYSEEYAQPFPAKQAVYGVADNSYFAERHIDLWNKSGLGSETLRLMEKEQELQEICNSMGYKALIAFKKMKIPFKAQIKKAIVSGYTLYKRAKKQ